MLYNQLPTSIAFLIILFSNRKPCYKVTLRIFYCIPLHCNIYSFIFSLEFSFFLFKRHTELYYESIIITSIVIIISNLCSVFYLSSSYFLSFFSFSSSSLLYNFNLQFYNEMREKKKTERNGAAIFCSFLLIYLMNELAMVYWV